MAAVGSVIYFALWVCVLLLIARFVLDWVQMFARQWRPRGLVAVLCEGIYSVTVHSCHKTAQMPRDPNLNWACQKTLLPRKTRRRQCAAG